MQRLYIPNEFISKTQVVFPEAQTHRVDSVLRLKTGDRIIVFNGLGLEYRVILTKVKKNEIIAEIESVEDINRDPTLKITLLQGLPKFEKMELIIQKATELGVNRIIPMITARTIPRLTAEKMKLRTDRWQKIAIAAAEQSGRTRIPEIKPPIPFSKGLTSSQSAELQLFFWEEEKKITLKSILKNQQKLISIAIFIGPEGGFTKEEAELAKQAGAVAVSLGSRLLRTETASLTVVSILLYEFE